MPDIHENERLAAVAELLCRGICRVLTRDILGGAALGGRLGQPLDSSLNSLDSPGPRSEGCEPPERERPGRETEQTDGRRA